jgi:hypothetical protein
MPTSGRIPPTNRPSRDTRASPDLRRRDQDRDPDDLGNEGDAPSNKRNTTDAGKRQDRGP